MLDVYICEDIPEERKLITHYVENAILIHEYHMEVRISTATPRDLIDQLKISDNTGIYFLDIDLKTEQNGLMLAEEIREYDPRGFIVFITSHFELSFMTFQYKTEALDFILKEEPKQLQNRINECLENAVKKHQANTRGSKKTLTITKIGRNLTLEYDHIMYFETSVNEHKLLVHEKHKTIEFFGKMKEIEKEVGEDFIRCHRSYLVNKKNILEINYKKKLIIMKNHSECPISYRMIGHVKNQFG